MSRTSFIILLGVVTILTPFSGLPIAMRSLTTIVLGVCVLAVGLSLRAHEMRIAKEAHAVSAPVEADQPQPQPVSPEPDILQKLEEQPTETKETVTPAEPIAPKAE